MPLTPPSVTPHFPTADALPWSGEMGGEEFGGFFGGPGDSSEEVWGQGRQGEGLWGTRAGVEGWLHMDLGSRL